MSYYTFILKEPFAMYQRSIRYDNNFLYSRFIPFFSDITLKLSYSQRLDIFIFRISHRFTSITVWCASTKCASSINHILSKGLEVVWALTFLFQLRKSNRKILESTCPR